MTRDKMTADEKADLRRQVADQCRVVAHLARAIAEVHEVKAKSLETGSQGADQIAEFAGERTARLMENLGDVLNGMDAVTEEDDWTTPIFQEAQRRFLGGKP